MSSVISIRIDEKLKNELEQTCESLGLNITTAFTIYAKKLIREKRIPFEVSIDPFYSKNNIKYLEKITKEIDNGTATLTEHPLTEVE